MHHFFPQLEYIKKAPFFGWFQFRVQNLADPHPARRCPVRAMDQGTAIGAENIRNVLHFFDISESEFHAAYNFFYGLSDPQNQ